VSRRLRTKTKKRGKKFSQVCCPVFVKKDGGGDAVFKGIQGGLGEKRIAEGISQGEQKIATQP